MLLKQGAKVASSEVASSLTPLMAASQCGHEDVVSELVRGGGNVNTKLKATGNVERGNMTVYNLRSRPLALHDHHGVGLEVITAVTDW